MWDILYVNDDNNSHLLSSLTVQGLCRVLYTPVIVTIKSSISPTFL